MPRETPLQCQAVLLSVIANNVIGAVFEARKGALLEESRSKLQVVGPFRIKALGSFHAWQEAEVPQHRGADRLVDP